MAVQGCAPSCRFATRPMPSNDISVDGLDRSQPVPCEALQDLQSQRLSRPRCATAKHNRLRCSPLRAPRSVARLPHMTRLQQERTAIITALEPASSEPVPDATGYRTWQTLRRGNLVLTRQNGTMLLHKKIGRPPCPGSLPIVVLSCQQSSSTGPWHWITGVSRPSPSEWPSLRFPASAERRLPPAGARKVLMQAAPPAFRLVPSTSRTAPFAQRRQFQHQHRTA